jgi:hypothetical protein
LSFFVLLYIFLSQQQAGSHHELRKRAGGKGREKRAGGKGREQENELID